jgi:hypothetical protein
MRVSAKALNRHVGSNFADGVENGTESATGHCCTNRIMASEDEKINGLGEVHGLLEPRLLDHVGCFDDFGDVAVAREIKQHSKSHDAETFIDVSNTITLPKLASAIPCGVVK